MPSIPRDPAPDGSIAFLREGYEFISRRCERLGSDVFETRMMLRKAFCARGAEAAEIFYGDARFTRVGAMPQSVVRLLQDKGSVQSLDTTAHRHRKKMFMSLMGEESIARLVSLFDEEWRAAMRDWEARDRVVLFDEVRFVLTRAVCRWAGVPLDERDPREVSRELCEMIDATGSVGPRNWRAQALRRRTERWIEGLTGRIRAGAHAAPEGSALQVMAEHRDLDGNLLPPPVVAVEVINILRPTVAVGRFITFSALALHEHPAEAEPLRQGGEDELWRFVQEVRRFYPFFPLIGGRVREPFEWRGHRFEDGDWMLFDLYGTNHDSRIWHEPGSFRPGRFRDWTSTGYDLVPQGAGGFEENHRCPGEWITIALMKKAVDLLAREMAYDVPDQDLTVPLSQMPSRPKSGMEIAAIRARA